MRKGSDKTVMSRHDPDSADRLRDAFRWMWRWYVYGCIAFGTLAVLYVLYAVFYYQYRYVQLPNGARLVATQWFEKKIALKNSRGDIVVQPDIDAIAWNDKYVEGWRRVSGEGYFHFIYKIGDPANVEYTQEEYRALLEQSGPTDHKETMNYFYLIDSPGYRRAWYE